MDRKELLIVCFLLAALVWIFPVYAPQQDSGAAPSNVTVAATIAISLSANLTDGLFNQSFETNTDDNFDPGMGGSAVLTTSNPGNNVTTVTNTLTELCIQQNSNLSLTTDDSVQISSYNYTYQGDSNSSNLTATQSIQFPTTPGQWTSVNNTIPSGTANYSFGFWIDIPSAQTLGEYNNTVTIKAIRASQTC